jgi:hypothetical protein
VVSKDAKVKENRKIGTLIALLLGFMSASAGNVSQHSVVI